MAESIRVTTTSTARSWLERNLGWKAEALAIAVLVIVIGALAAQVLLGLATTPATYAAAYVSAMAAGNADAAWDAMVVETSGTTSDATLLTKPALAAMLRLPANRAAISEVQGKTITSGDNSASVAVSYREAQATRHVTVSLVREPAHKRYLFFPVWRVMVSPSVLQLAIPAGAGAVSIDGQQLPATAKTIGVFPGSHQVELAASTLFLADSETVNANAAQSPVLLKVKLTEQAAAQAAEALKAAMVACAKATTLQPVGCPQSVIDNINGGAQWQLFGDPAAGAAYTADSAGQVVGDGHYQMAVAYQGQSPALPRHRAVAGTYHAIFGWDGQHVVVKTIGAGTAAVAEVPKPSIDDAAVLAQVKARFDQCAAASVPAPADCPQSVYTLGILANFRWRLEGDPTSAARVSFDGTQSMYRVSGSYSMTATYDETFPYQPTFHRSNPSTGTYTAEVFWDGEKPVFVSFE